MKARDLTCEQEADHFRGGVQVPFFCTHTANEKGVIGANTTENTHRIIVHAHGYETSILSS